MKHNKKNNKTEYMRRYMRQRRKEGRDNYQERNKKLTQYREEMKRKAIRYKGSVCARCNEAYPAVCFDFHHTSPKSKDVTPSKILYKSWEKIVIELDKCILVCSNCHRIIHEEDDYSHLKEKPVQTIKIQIEMF